MKNIAIYKLIDTYYNPPMEICVGTKKSLIRWAEKRLTQMQKENIEDEDNDYHTITKKELNTEEGFVKFCNIDGINCKHIVTINEVDF